MRKQTLILALLAISFTVNAQRSTKLFNGKNLDGWALVTKELGDIPAEEYRVERGCIELSGKFGYIYTVDKYSEYKLSLEWRWMGEGSNSGVFINMQGDSEVWPSTYEMQLAHETAGAIIHSNSFSSSYDGKVGKKYMSALNKGLEMALGEWNKMDVIVNEDSIEVYVNGTKQNEISGLSNRGGHIGLQSEGKGIQFRNVVIEEL